MHSYLAPAKLNLFLHITARRADGYHCLQTIFHFLDYCDVLNFSIRSDGQVHCYSTMENLPPEQDLTWRAAKLLQQHTHTPLGVDIQVQKKIPVGGGLGGGSSDAATTLLALNKLWELHLSNTELAQLGLKLGADVPIFLFGHTAWAEGVGEKLTAVDIPETFYLIIHPGCHVSTAEIFSAKDLTRNKQPIIMSSFLEGQSVNVCEPVVCKRYPQVKQALDWLTQYSSARMTGTGSCVFAPFTTNMQAQAILAKLPKAWSGFVASGLNKSPAFRSVAKV